MNIGEKFYCSKCMREIEVEDICPYCGHDHSKENGIHMLEEGTLLHNGRYQIGAGIGAGGFGITYAAWDLTLNTPVAIKEFFPQNLCARNTRENYHVTPDSDHKGLYQASMLRFIREARVLGTLQNVKNVVPVLEWFEENNTAYIVMKYIHGETLADYVNNHDVSPQKLIKMIQGLIDSLILVHAQGILHRDISPTNIMVEEDGTLVLIDFGAAAAVERMTDGKDRTVIFNKKYAPLEQYDENGMQGPWTDVYALSASMYDLICGEPPVEATARMAKDTLKSPKERGIPLKKWQNEAIMHGLAIQPEKRIQSMEIFRSVLYHLPMPEEVKRRRRFAAAAAAAAVLMTLLGIIITINFTYGFTFGNGIRYSLSRDGWHTRGYSYDREELILPEKLLGINVVQIDEGAFQGSKKLTNAVIPGTIDTVSEFAFNKCENLVSILIKDGVKTLAPQSFSGCSSLQTVFIPDSIEDLTQETFADSKNHLVLIGSTSSKASRLADDFDLFFADIETEANETGLTILSYKTNQEKAFIPDQIFGIPVTEINSGVPDLPVFPNKIKSITLPENLEKIGDNAFANVHISEIVFPQTLESIGKYAFLGSFLESLELPESVNSVGDGAFSANIKLKTVILSENMEEIPAGCFGGDTSMESAYIPEGIRKIAPLAFSKCRELKTLFIPKGTKYIDRDAFRDCENLETIYLPSSVVKIDPSAVYGCPNSLTIIGLKETLAETFAQKNGFDFYNMDQVDQLFSASAQGGLFLKDGIAESRQISLPSYYQNITIKKVSDVRMLKSEDVVLPRYVENVGYKSFYGNTYLKKVTAPDTLQIIDTFAFGKCENLEEVDIRKDLKKISYGAFWNCSKLSKIDIPSGVKTLGYSTFDGCSSLTDISIPSSLTVLDDDVFARTGITSVTVPGNISKCTTSFYGCIDLKNAVIEEGVRTLQGTFANCENLETVVIPSSVRLISRSTFQNCSNLTDIWIYSDDVDLDSELGGVKHREIFGIDENGKLIFDTLYMEMDNNIPLFGDSPDLTIHAHRGSSAHTYANIHSINFEVIPEDKEIQQETNTPDNTSYIVPEQIYSEDELIEILTPKKGQTGDEYWNQFRYSLGYGLTDLAYQNLQACGSDDPEMQFHKIMAHSALLFLEQSLDHGYKTGAAIAFIEDYQSHPTLKTGDIIVEIDGESISGNDDISRIRKTSKSDFWVFTILRENSKGELEKMDVSVSSADPLIACGSISPNLFEIYQ